jgi:hypothetical protein
MLGSKGSADGSRLHGSQQKASKCEREQRIEVRKIEIGKADNWESLRHFAQKLHALGIQMERRRGQNAADDDEKRNGSVLQKRSCRE